MEYSTREDVKNAIRKLDGADLNGRKLKLTEEKASRSRYRRCASTLTQCMQCINPHTNGAKPSVLISFQVLKCVLELYILYLGEESVILEKA